MRPCSPGLMRHTRPCMLVLGSLKFDSVMLYQNRRVVGPPFTQSLLLVGQALGPSSRPQQQQQLLLTGAPT